MRYLITTDKPLEPFVADLPNTDKWNNDLKEFQKQVRFAEFYSIDMYAILVGRKRHNLVQDSMAFY
jgi:hypothetical protein